MPHRTLRSALARSAQVKGQPALARGLAESREEVSAAYAGGSRQGYRSLRALDLTGSAAAFRWLWFGAEWIFPEPGQALARARRRYSPTPKSAVPAKSIQTFPSGTGVANLKLSR